MPLTLDRIGPTVTTVGRLVGEINDSALLVTDYSRTLT